jgi:hypothetical protein
MQTIAKEICNAIEDRDDLSLIKVAQYIGASKQCMSKFKSKSEIGFRYLLRLSYLLFPNDQKEKMAEWCMRLDSVESISQSFEYAATTRNIELLSNLITKHANEKGTIAEFVAIYTIIYKYMIDEISGFDLIAHVKRCGKIKDESLKVLIEILKCYNYFFQRKFHLMLETAHEAEKALLFLGKRELFFKECYLHRIAEVLDHAYLFLNNLELARYYAFIIINADICPKTVSDASYIVGMTYLLEDEGKCLEYLQKSYDIAKTIGDHNIEHEARMNLDFVKLYLNVKLHEDSDATLINFQNNKESEINLNSLKEVMYLKGEDDLIVLFEAISSGSIQKFHECFLGFFQQTNYFFASIMAKELRDRGDTSIWAIQAMNFTIKTEEGNNFEKDFISGFSRFGDCSERGCA